jgi:hypothetical protein
VDHRRMADQTMAVRFLAIWLARNVNAG